MRALVLTDRKACRSALDPLRPLPEAGGVTAVNQMSGRCTHVVFLDEGQATNLDGLALSVAIFGGGRFQLLCSPDRGTLRDTADQLARIDAVAAIVVDVDHHPEPKSVLADAANAGFPLVVLSDGRHEAIPDHALSVGAAAYLPTSLPGRELVAQLAALASSADRPAAWE